ncbi:MAG: M28 family peptidase [Bacteroidota bacterium]
MKSIRIVFPILLVAFAIQSFAQTVPFDRERFQLEQHVKYLASDDLEGRETGTPGELKAATYIFKVFQDLKMKPMGGNGSFLQPFEVIVGKDYGTNNSFICSKQVQTLDKDYLPLEYSSNGSVKGKMVYVGHGITTPDGKHDDYAGIKKIKNRILIVESGTPDSENPHSELAQFGTIRNKIKIAESKGARAVVFINSDENAPDPEQDFGKNIKPSSIPVLFAYNAEKLLSLNGQKAEINVDLIADKRTGHNVVGMIDNNSENTIIIGGHYDHLGYGEFGSRYMGKEKKIHNGADDNASGISVMIELAKSLSNTELKSNVLFIGFSGEEMGLLGSKYYIENPTINLEEVSYMINLDMIGMMKNRTLIINGTGTSPAWGNLLVEAKPKAWGLELVTNESGIGPSDHTSFYLKDIPVLALFTGTHDYYHKPEDDWERLNYMGMHLIHEFLRKLITASDDDGKLEFTKTKDKQNEGGRRKFTVTMGVMPSYSYQGEGMKIDGVSDGNPAQKGGLEAGDIILGIGKFEVKDIYGYMDALGGHKKGQSVPVKVKRGEEILNLEVTF